MPVRTSSLASVLLLVLIAILATACGPQESTDAPETLGDLSPSELQELCTDIADAVIDAQDAGVDNATILRTFADGAGIGLSEAQTVFRLCLNTLE